MKIFYHYGADFPETGPQQGNSVMVPFGHGFVAGTVSQFGTDEEGNHLYSVDFYQGNLSIWYFQEDIIQDIVFRRE